MFLLIKWRWIPISVYDWMKSNELRFIKMKRKRKTVERIITHLNSLDSFVEQDNQDKIFDNNFSKEDFLKLTKKWEGDNLEV